MGIDGKDLFLFGIYTNTGMPMYELAENAIATLPAATDRTGVYLVFFVKNLKNRILLEQIFNPDVKKTLRAKARSALGAKKLSLQCIYIIHQEMKEQDVKLTHLKRHEMLQVPPICAHVNLEGTSKPSYEDQLNALVFTIDLFQLVELYNLIGDQLYKYNVRFGIQETLGVDQAIRNTLEQEPERFWFKNNGVTILVESPDFRPQSVEELLLGHIYPGTSPDFSVVNGAQTITTAAQYFYEKEYAAQNAASPQKEAITEKLSASKKAQVLLRVIHVPATHSAQSPTKSTAKDISVSLNRQKPIKKEDIAYTSYFVEKMVGYLEDRPSSLSGWFRLVRRGEGNDAARLLDLVSFARARAACIQDPAAARSQSSNELLKSQPTGEDGYVFSHRSIFTEDWTDADKPQEDAVFSRDYGAVWFAHQLAQAYDKCRRQITEGAPTFLTVVGNGKWYFTAAMVQLFNGFCTYHAPSGRELPDFSAFSCHCEDLREILLPAIQCFAQIVALYASINRDYTDLNSNHFKKNDLFKDVLELLHGEIPVPQASTNLGRLLQKDAELLSEEIQRLQTLAASVYPPVPAAAPPAVSGQTPKPLANRIVLNGKTSKIDSVVQAMLDTAAYILNTYPTDSGQLESACASWLFDPASQNTLPSGYFKGPVRQIMANGHTYRIGTYSNTESKCRQIRQLCKLADVPKGEIFWYMNDPEKPIFSW